MLNQDDRKRREREHFCCVRVRARWEGGRGTYAHEHAHARSQKVWHGRTSRSECSTMASRLVLRLARVSSIVTILRHEICIGI